MSVALYILGYAVEGIYFGSLGIVSFEVLRVRYLLVGLLFAVFLASVLLPVRSLTRSLVKAREASFVRLLLLFLRTTLPAYLAVIVAFSSLDYLSRQRGFVLAPPVSVPPEPWLLWLQRLPENVALTAVVFVFLVAAFNTLAVVIIGIPQATMVGYRLWKERRATPSTSPPPTPRKLSRQDWVDILGAGFEGILRLLVVVFAVAFLVRSFLFLTAPDGNGATQQWPYWGRLLLFSFLIYSAYGLLLVSIAPVAGRDESESTPVGAGLSKGWDASLQAVVVTLLLLPIMTVYAVRLFPLLPYHIGGGAAVPVVLQVKAGFVPVAGWPTDGRVFLVDRSDSRALCAVPKNANSGGGRLQVVELPLASIEAIAYQ
jgi:hypothetical protein